MRWALLFVAGCARVLGLDDIHPHAGIAPLSCPDTPEIAPGDYSQYATLFTGAVAPSPDQDQTLMYLSTNGALSYSMYGGGWSAPATVTTLSDPGYYTDRPSLSYDGNHIYVARHPMPTGNALPYEAYKIAGAGETWDTVTPVAYPSVLGGNDVTFGVPTADGRRVLVTYGVVSHYHFAELAMTDAGWTLIDTTSALYPATGDVSDTDAQLSPDGCWAVFARIDHAVGPDHDLWFAIRGTDGLFQTPQKLVTVDTLQDEQHPWLSPDGATLYYYTKTLSTTYIAPRM